MTTRAQHRCPSGPQAPGARRRAAGAPSGRGLRSARAPGFTLLEVMLAVTILAIVAVAVYGTFSRTLRSKGLAEGHIEVTHAGRAAVGRMAEEIAAAFYPEGSRTGAIFRGLPGGTESAPLDALVFSTVSARPSGHGNRDSDQRIISYFFPPRPLAMRSAADTEPDGGAFFTTASSPAWEAAGLRPERLLRRETFMTPDDTAAALPAFTVLDNVASLGFRFHDGTTWLDAWDSEDRVTHYRRLPRAVAIDLALYDARGTIHHFATAVDLPLADPRPGPARAVNAPATPVPRGTP